MARAPSPWGTFSFLGIPCGATIEFRYKDEGIFLNGPEETFTVAPDQEGLKKLVIYEYERKNENYTEPLYVLTCQLWNKRNKKMNTKLTKRWVLEYWTYYDPKTKMKRILSDIYNEKKEQSRLENL